VIPVRRSSVTFNLDWEGDRGKSVTIEVYHYYNEYFIDSISTTLHDGDHEHFEYSLD